MICGLLIAQRSLFDHVRGVLRGLEKEGLDGGRAAVAHVVGRDPENLDEHGVGLLNALDDIICQVDDDGEIAVHDADILDFLDVDGEVGELRLIETQGQGLDLAFQGWLDERADDHAHYKSEPADFEGKLELLLALQRDDVDLVVTEGAHRLPVRRLGRLTG